MLESAFDARGYGGLENTRWNGCWKALAGRCYRPWQGRWKCPRSVGRGVGRSRICPLEVSTAFAVRSGLNRLDLTGFE